MSSPIGELYVILSTQTAELVAGFERGGAAGEDFTVKLTQSMATADDAVKGLSEQAAAGAESVAAAQGKMADSAAEAASAEERLAATARSAAGASRDSAGAMDAEAAAAGRAADATGMYRDEQGRLRDASGRYAAEETAAAGATKASAASASGGRHHFGLLAVAVLAAGAASVKMAGDFQQSMTRLVTSAGETRSNLAKVSQGVLDLSTSTNTSTKQLAAGMYMVESAGFHGAAGLQVLKAAAEGAQAEGADLSTVANAVTSGLNAYGLSASHATSFTNQMVVAVGRGKMTMQDLAGSMSAVLPVAAAAHLSFAQVGGAIATMTAQGMSAQQASQDLAHTIRALQAPSQVQVAEMQQLGLNSNRLAKNLGRAGLTGTISQLEQAILTHMGRGGEVLLSAFNKSRAAAQDAETMISAMPAPLARLAKGYLDGSTSAMQWRTALYGLPPLQRNLAMQFATVANKAHGFNDLLKSGQPAAQTFTSALSKVMGGATGLNAALMVGGSHMATFKANAAAVGAAAGRTGADVTGWAEIQHNFNFQLGAAAKAAESAGTSLGTVLLPAATSVMRVVASFGMTLAHNAAAGRALALVIGGLLATALAHKLVQGLSLSAKGFQDLQTAGGKLLGLFVRTSAASETSAAAAGLQASATEAATAATEAETGAMAGLDTAMTANPIGIIVVAIAALVIGLIELYRHCQLVREIVADVGHFFAAVWAGAMHLAGEAVQWFVHGPLVWIKQQVAVLTQFWAQHSQEIEQIARTVWSVIATIVRVYVIGTVTTVKIAMASLEAAVKSAMAVIKTVWAVAWAVIRDSVRTTWSVISTIIHTNLQVITSIIGAVIALITGHWSQAGHDLMNATSAMWHGIVNIITTVTSGFGHLLWDAGRALIEGLIGGIKSMIGAAVGAVENIGSSIVGGLKGMLGIHSPSTVMRDIALQIAQGLVKGLEGSASQVKAAASKIATDIKDAISAGMITQQRGETLTKWMQRDNVHLQDLANRRAAILKEIQAAQKYASTVATNTQQAYSITSIAGSGPVSSQSVLATLRMDLGQIRRFHENIRKLARMGLNKTLLDQIIQAGPLQGGQVAQALVDGPASNIRAISKAESGIVSASKSLGREAADAMYDSGRDAGKGFLAGLKHQQHAIEEMMRHIARSMVRALKHDLGISSPSTVLRQHGQDAARGFELGLADGVSGVEGAARRLAAVTTATGGSGGRFAGGGQTVVNVHVHMPVHGFVGHADELAEKVYQAAQAGALAADRRNPVTGNGLALLTR